MADPGIITDILLAPPAPRQFGQKSTNDQLVTVTLAFLTNSLAARQHRDILIDIGALVAPSDIANLASTASAGYVQAELQAVIDKLDAITANQRTILTLLRDLISSASTKILSIDTGQ